jgi:hypothetical protein
MELAWTASQQELRHVRVFPLNLKDKLRQVVVVMIVGFEVQCGQLQSLADQDWVSNLGEMIPRSLILP